LPVLIEETVSVSIETDEEGYLGRECLEYEKYFKVKRGTGIPNVPACHCTYCNHIGDQDTLGQGTIRYAQSVAFRQFGSPLLGELKKLER